MMASEQVKAFIEKMNSEDIKPGMSKVEIKKMVYERFPVTKAERTCRDEKKIMDDLRKAYRKKLIEQSKEKREYK